METTVSWYPYSDKSHNKQPTLALAGGGTSDPPVKRSSRELGSRPLVLCELLELPLINESGSSVPWSSASVKNIVA